jgi:hypothetical protein
MLEPKVGTTLAQIANCRIRLVETEMRIKEQEELVVRLEQLEELFDQKEARRWG